jgi:uncharacterized membrane protein YhaH (DUF805 family)
MDYFLSAITEHYADFQGRARRQEFWMFALFYWISYLLAIVLDNILGLSFIWTMGAFGLATGDQSLDEINLNTAGIGWISVLLVMGLFLPILSVSVRRLHDRGRSAWFLLIWLIPFVGPIWGLVELCCDSQPGDNQYGSNPKLAPAASPSTQPLPTPGTNAYSQTPATPRASEADAPASGRRFCPACGAPNLPSGAFCAGCGKALPQG